MSIENTEKNTTPIDEEIDEFTQEEIIRWEEKQRNQEYPDYVYRKGIDYGNATGY